MSDTMMRSQTDEQLAARWDSEPYFYEADEPQDSRRLTAQEHADEQIGRFDPRVECVPPRDVPGMIDAVRCDDGTWDQVELYEGAFEDAGDTDRPPVNPILTAFRGQPQESDMAKYWVESLSRGWRLPGQYWTGLERDHARKVLTKLAALA